MGKEVSTEEQNVKKKKGNFLFPLVMVVCFVAAAIFMYKQNADAPTIAIDGVEFQLKSSAQDLADAGFEITGGESLPAKSWNSGYYLEKNGKTYAALTMYNATNETKPIEECNIGEMSVGIYMEHEVFTINGVAPISLSRDEVRETFGFEEDDTILGKDLGYTYVQFSDYNDSTDTFERVKLKCDFDQSYE